MSNKSTAPSAVRKALEEVNEAQRLEPFSAADLVELGDVMLWRILVEPYIPKQRGLIARPPSIDEAERIVSKVGRVVQVGELCYQSKTQSGLELARAKIQAKPGEYYLFEMYAGQEVSLRSGHILRILTETELLMRVNDPDLLRGYL